MTDIENYAHDEGKRIAKITYSKYGDDQTVKFNSLVKSFLDNLLGRTISRLKIESEIYGSALYKSNAFFSKNKNARSDDRIIEILRKRLSQRTERTKDIKKLEPEEMLANVIKIEAFDFLAENSARD